MQEFYIDSSYSEPKSGPPQPNDPESCLALANWLEAAAAELRRRAERLKREKRNSLRRDILRHKAAKIAFAYMRNGLRRDYAIENARRETGYEFQEHTIECNLKQLERRLAARSLFKRDRRAQQLIDMGLSVRETAKELRTSKSTVSRRILCMKQNPPTPGAELQPEGE